MIESKNTSLEASVDKQIKSQYLFEEDENCINTACSKDYVQACQTIIEWSTRIPHLLPFQINESIRKDIRGRMNYKNAILYVMSTSAHNVFQDNNFAAPVMLKVSPAVQEITWTAREWVLLKEEEDPEFFAVVAVNHERLYQILPRLDKQIVAAYANQLSIILRKKLMDAGFREKLHSFKRNSTEIYKQLMAAAHQAWIKHSSILLIRLDFGYRRRVPDLRGSFASKEDYEQRFRKMAQYREIMLKVLRNMYGKDIAFYAWKIECATVRGLHTHWLIGLNGAKHQDRINIPKAIAQKWDEVIGDEHVYTWNLNADQKHENAILRVINYSDPMLWRIVGGYSDYLTKVDYLVRHRTPQGMRSFGCSKITTSRSKAKKGPKRSKSMPALDMLKVRRSFAETSIQTNMKEST